MSKPRRPTATVEDHRVAGFESAFYEPEGRKRRNKSASVECPLCYSGADNAIETMAFAQIEGRVSRLLK